MAKPITGCIIAAPMSENRAEIACRFLVETLCGYQNIVPSGTVRAREPGEQGVINDLRSKAAKDVPA